MICGTTGLGWGMHVVMNRLLFGAVFAVTVLASASAYATATVDSTPPTLRSLTLTPSSVDVSGVGANITVEARITDDNSGCNWATLTVKSVESPMQSFSVVLERVSGTPQDGVYRAVGTIGKYATPGTWRVSLTRFDDVAGNIKFWDPDTLKAAGFQTDIAVANTPDTTPPITTSDAAVTYVGSATIHLTANDNVNGSGVASTHYRLDGGTDTLGMAVSVGLLGRHTLEFWSVDVAGNVETPRKTADFTVTPDTYTLTYSAGTGGTISGTSPQTVNQSGSGTAVTAVPSAGCHFVSWSDGVLTAVRTDANVTASKSVTANFAINSYTLTYTAGAGGTISGTSPQTVNHDGSGTAVTAVPNVGYHFVGWSDGSSANPRTDAGVTANKTVSAMFAVDAPGTRTLVYTAGIGGAISGTSPQTIVVGGSGTAVSAVANVGYHFVGWSDGVTTAVRKDTNVTANLTVTASFASAQVATKLTMNVSPTRLSLGHSAHFFGVIAPNMPDRTPIRLMVRKAGQTKWTNLAPYVRTSGGYHWSFYYHPNTRGTYYFKVQFAATATHLGSTSRTVTVVWK